MEIKIAYLYPEILSHYGDRGNIITLKHRAEKRSINVEVKEYSLEEDLDTEDIDIIYIGGGTEKSQLIALDSLNKMKDKIISYVQNDGVILAVCTGYEILGKSFELDGKSHEGIGVLDITASSGKNRLIGNIVTENKELGFDIVGFENHLGRVKLGSSIPLGKVKSGYGNDDSSGFEGTIYKNVIGTYIHGPLLPKNPKLADYIIGCCLKKKYNEFNLPPIDDELEIKAHNYAIEKFTKK